MAPGISCKKYHGNQHIKRYSKINITQLLCRLIFVFSETLHIFVPTKRGKIDLGDQSPLFCYHYKNMIDKNKIEKIVNEHIAGTDMFLVSLKVSTANRITVLADTMKGITIDECAELHRFLEKQLDRNTEDFELQVSSPGLNAPFRVIQQYYRNEGNMIELTDMNGEKFTGKLRNVTEGGFELETVIKGRGKNSRAEEISFNYDQVKAAKAVLTIN